MPADYEMITLETETEWRQWLSNHHATTDGVWLRMHKKASGLPTVTYAEALDHALCFGWIDGIRKSYDESSFVQKFTPRRKASLWSKRNIEYIERLIAAGQMTPAGLAEVDRAKNDGRWAAAYDRPSEMVPSPEFLAALDTSPKAKARFETLNKTNRYAIAWQLQTAKTDVTRLRRQTKIIAMLEAGDKQY